MSDHSKETVLLVCSDEKHSFELLERLSDSGFDVLGPAPSAAVALALAAHSRPTVALVAAPPTGRRKAPELADLLMRDWGVRSLVLGEAWDGEDDEAQWGPSAAQRARLSRALGLDHDA